LTSDAFLTIKVDKLPHRLSRESGAVLITKKNQYALRAIFELAKHNGKGPKKISEIAKAQAIPEKFLEVILNQLKGSGLVDSKRGFYGGYYLIRNPEKITVGDIMRFLEGDVDPTDCVALVPETNCPFKGDCAFFPMWNRIKDAIFNVYDETTIQGLIDSEKADVSCR
jgi:Rrf2 family protein